MKPRYSVNHAIKKGVLELSASQTPLGDRRAVFRVSTDGYFFSFQEQHFLKIKQLHSYESI